MIPQAIGLLEHQTVTDVAPGQRFIIPDLGLIAAYLK
jgi:hypothetical protein